MFLNIQIDLLILKTYYGQFTSTTKNHCISSLRHGFLRVHTRSPRLWELCLRGTIKIKNRRFDCLIDWLTPDRSQKSVLGLHSERLLEATSPFGDQDWSLENVRFRSLLREYAISYRQSWNCVHQLHSSRANWKFFVYFILWIYGVFENNNS